MGHQITGKVKTSHLIKKGLVDQPFLRKGVTMTHLADEGNPTPIMEWVEDPPFLMEGVTLTLLTEIKGGSVKHRESHDYSPGSKGLWPTFPQEGSHKDSPR